MYEDRFLTCRDCGVEFTFSASEQEFFAEKGFTNEPGRCPSCRAARKNDTRRGPSAGGFRQQRQMFPVVCASCGKDTEVPFQPSGDRPVYCSDCFRKEKSY
jgi:CxxC-x17-CxxC domain-containing protein